MFRRSTFRHHNHQNFFLQSSALLRFHHGSSPSSRPGGGGGSVIASAAPKDDPYFLPYDEMNKATTSRIQSIIAQILATRAITPKEHHHLQPMLAEWVACEKVHGSNFGMYLIDGCTKFRVAKRSAFLPMAEHFFGVHVLLPQMERWSKKILALLDEGKIHQPGVFPGYKNRNNNNNNSNNSETSNNNSSSSSTTAAETTEASSSSSSSSTQESLIDTLVINGELFGAKYRHPQLDVHKVSRKFYLESGKLADVQSPQADRFPQYTNELMFAGFDIRYRLKNDSSKKVFTVPFDATVEIFEKVMQDELQKENEKRFLYCKPLFRGKLEEIIMFDLQRLTTTVPLLQGMGDHYFRNNLSEGVVLRNVQHGHPELNNDTVSSILKYKNSYFNEMRHVQKDKDGKPIQKPLKDFKDELANLKKDLSTAVEKRIPLPDNRHNSSHQQMQWHQTRSGHRQLPVFHRPDQRPLSHPRGRPWRHPWVSS